MGRDRKMTNRQLASAKAALGISSSAVELKRSFRYFAVMKQAQEITYVRLGWLARAAFVWLGRCSHPLELRILFAYTGTT
jgi:hypothetical protein